MRSIKINQMAAAWLLTVGISMMEAQGLSRSVPECPSSRTVQENIITSVGVEISIPFISKVGEV